ncbi:ApaLI family restriction endonuclease [Campylobacter coli]|nr:ApaLI family restriction endonuclease [Campylobacter coli]EAJ2845410.1 ApaLI family restriction endonuclease [Campylobacter coli]
MDEMYGIIKNLADNYSQCLSFQIENRTKEMLTDDISHYLIYEVLGITSREGELIDLYQNKGRFLYKYAGAFLEDATIACFQYKHKNAEKVKIPNTIGIKPKTFEIDCLIGNEAHEIKWRDATTDGDHITKEHTRIQAIKENGYIPIRVMFYYPQREQAIKIQSILQTLYEGVGGKYYAGNNAWEYVYTYTGINLLKILEDIAIARRNHVIQ